MLSKITRLPLLEEQLQTYLSGPLESGETPLGVVNGFTGISPQKLRWWRIEKEDVKAQDWIKLVGFLWAIMGSPCVEVSEEEGLRVLFKGLGIGVIPFAEIREKIGVDQKSLSLFLRGNGKMSPEPMFRLDDLAQEPKYQRRVEEKLESLKRIRLKN